MYTTMPATVAQGAPGNGGRRVLRSTESKSCCYACEGREDERESMNVYRVRVAIRRDKLGINGPQDVQFHAARPFKRQQGDDEHCHHTVEGLDQHAPWSASAGSAGP